MLYLEANSYFGQGTNLTLTIFLEFFVWLLNCTLETFLTLLVKSLLKSTFLQQDQLAVDHVVVSVAVETVTVDLAVDLAAAVETVAADQEDINLLQFTKIYGGPFGGRFFYLFL